MVSAQAAIVLSEVAIVALLTGLNHAVAAAGRNLELAAGVATVGGQDVAIVTFLAAGLSRLGVPASDAVAATGRLAGAEGARGAGVVVYRIAVIASLGRPHKTIAAEGQ